jgi:hypothetical protein
MPAPLYHFFSEGAWNIVYGWAREIIVEVGVMLLERGRVFAVGRAARYASLSSYFRVANDFSARVAFEQHTGQLWTPLLRADFPSIKYVLG